MCGIAGIIDYEKPLDRGVLERMQAALRHRGPDGQGLRMLPHAGLAHTRLSLLDLARGSQPMHSPDARYWIVYNGEVYNFRELRRDLRDSWDFSTDCDTEVVLAAWAGRLGVAMPDAVQWHVCLLHLGHAGGKGLAGARPAGYQTRGVDE
uniref:asparagine synthase (glutamine-hydrolyzing) n=1 Tax=Candidatus Kentrum sp. LPFa TaxID=2126335 RepID=A0A450VUG3_9GAMM|nr:MAG: Glutamine amidotransferase domain-containing protein [Candidatus Kentron sp. LPFa]VFK24673.1 MAG: Glutamine amidotransferase domain-containing protein [Candidatus Kentron sp. LPFa]